MAEDNVEPLVTECPNCQTRFRVTESQLQVAAGRVRCGACLTVFQGVEYLLWDDEPQFENDSEAQSALDDLLSELGDDGSPASADESPALDSEAAAQAGEDAEEVQTDLLPDLEGVGNDVISVGSGLDDEEWSQPGHQLYGGHEEPSELAPEELQRIEQTLFGEDAQSGEVGAEVDFDDNADVEADVEELLIDQVAGEFRQESTDDEDNNQAPNGLPDEMVDELEGAPHEADLALAEPAWKPAEPEPFTFGEEPEPRRWWVSMAIAGAITALLAQVLWFQFETWARDPTLRPVYGVICQVLDCELPVLQDIGSMLAQNLVVRSHPEVANALLVDAIIVNQAAFVQPFPVLELRFTSLDGNLVAGRRFQPEEYLAGELAGATVMQAQIPIHVELAIEDPGSDAVNYFLTFR